MSQAPEFLDNVPSTCTVGQIGDREWWCVTHRRNAEDCQVVSVLHRAHPDCLDDVCHATGTCVAGGNCDADGSI